MPFETLSQDPTYRVQEDISRAGLPLMSSDCLSAVRLAEVNALFALWSNSLIHDPFGFDLMMILN